MENKILATLVIFACLAVCLGADKETPKLPQTALGLITKLKATKGIYTTWEVKLNYVKEKDLPYLVKLLDSNEPCAYSVMAISSNLPSGNSTVGNEAAYLIESFWKRYYPIRQTSADKGIPTKLELKRWYKIWANLKKIEKRTASNIKLMPLNEIPGQIKEFVADLRLARHYSSHFKDFKITQKDIEKILNNYHTVSKAHWLHGYSHLEGEDRTGYLILKNGEKVEWLAKPGGLATLKLANGKMIYLAKDLTKWVKKNKPETAIDKTNIIEIPNPNKKALKLCDAWKRLRLVEFRETLLPFLFNSDTKYKIGDSVRLDKTRYKIIKIIPKHEELRRGGTIVKLDKSEILLKSEDGKYTIKMQAGKLIYSPKPKAVIKDIATQEMYHVGVGDTITMYLHPKPRFSQRTGKRLKRKIFKYKVISVDRQKKQVIVEYKNKKIVIEASSSKLVG